MCRHKLLANPYSALTLIPMHSVGLSSLFLYKYRIYIKIVVKINTIIVAGTITLQYRPHLIICPFFAAVAMPTTLADAPIGVALPPISVPIANAHANTDN